MQFTFTIADPEDAKRLMHELRRDPRTGSKSAALHRTGIERPAQMSAGCLE